jgi:hypothetical protein
MVDLREGCGGGDTGVRAAGQWERWRRPGRMESRDGIAGIHAGFMGDAGRARGRPNRPQITKLFRIAASRKLVGVSP